MKCMQFVGPVAAALLVSLLGMAPPQVTETAQITGGSFELNRPYKVGLNLKLKVTRSSGSNFDSLVGPLPNATVGTATTLAANQVGTPTGNRVDFVLSGDGYVYMSGVQPYGGTDGGSATSDGTIMVVQRVTAGGSTYHRYFRLKATRDVDVTGVNPPSSATITLDNHYVEKTTGGSLSAQQIPIPTAQGDPIKTFIDDVLALAAGAGLPVP